jgi:hypothetical protein
MRTTLVLDDELIRRAKHRANELNLTVSEVVNHALRLALTERPAVAPPFSMPTYGDPGVRVHHEPAELGPAVDDEEAARGSR